MALRIGDNFSYLGKKFLDSRESFDTLQEMYACSDVPEGFITYCKEDKKRYEFKENQWIEFVVDSSGNVSEEQLSGYQQKTDVNLTTTDKTIVGAINEIHGQINSIATENDINSILEDL